MFTPFLVVHAADIQLSHTLTNVTEGADSATLSITLHVENTGVTDYNNLTLDYVPLMIMAIDPVSVNLISIGEGQVIDVPITIVTPLPFSQNRFQQESLDWAREHDNPDESGTLVEFPAISHSEGGAS